MRFEADNSPHLCRWAGFCRTPGTARRRQVSNKTSIPHGVRYFGLMAHQNNRLSPNRKVFLTRPNTSLFEFRGTFAAQGPLMSMRYQNTNQFVSKPPRCSSCAQIMRLVRITSRFGDLPDLHVFECRACGVSHIEVASIENPEIPRGSNAALARRGTVRPFCG